jgi:ankyrin repeat protein
MHSTPPAHHHTNTQAKHHIAGIKCAEAASMEPIHRAAWDGDVAAIDQLVAEDGERLNAQIEDEEETVNGEAVTGCSPLMLAARFGQEAAVARLLALGADVGVEDSNGDTAAHLACYDGHSSVRVVVLG